MNTMPFASQKTDAITFPPLLSLEGVSQGASIAMTVFLGLWLKVVDPHLS